MCLLFAHHPKRLFVGHRMDICRALQRGLGVYITWTCPRGLVSDIWRKKIFVEPSKILHYTGGLCLICVQRSLLRRRTLHGYLWFLQSSTLNTDLSQRLVSNICPKKNITWIFVDPSKVLHYTDLSQRRPRCWCDRPQCGGTWPSNRQTWQNRTRLVSISKGKGKYNYECKYKYKGFNRGFWSSQNRLHHV